MNKYIALCLLLMICRIAYSQSLDPTDLDNLQIKTLSSLEKITDDLYVLDYRADYYFSEFLTRGIGNFSILDFIEKYLDTIPRSSIWSCSAFMAKNDKDIIVGRNFDWQNIPGLILYTTPKNGHKSISLVPVDLLLNKNAKTVFDNRKLLWAPYFPVDGMNNKGLFVAELAVEGEKVYNENKITLASLHLIRLLLDYASSLDEALVLLNNYNNEASYRSHFFIADSSGRSAVVEYTDNMIVITRNKKTWQVVTNTMVYKKSENSLRNVCNRYKAMSQYFASNNGSVSTSDALNVLRNVSIEGEYSSQYNMYSSTQWSVSYNLNKRYIDIVSERDYDNIYHFELDSTINRNQKFGDPETQYK
ncbi:MAG: linear amide C-N hydrolase [Bacteroidales bacterium]|nr:linear amide C-N hydrolase [Bacteroidales bacterium]